MKKKLPQLLILKLMRESMQKNNCKNRNVMNKKYLFIDSRMNTTVKVLCSSESNKYATETFLMENIFVIDNASTHNTIKVKNQ